MVESPSWLAEHFRNKTKMDFSFPVNNRHPTTHNIKFLYMILCFAFISSSVYTNSWFYKHNVSKYAYMNFAYLLNKSSLFYL